VLARTKDDRPLIVHVMAGVAEQDRETAPLGRLQFNRRLEAEDTSDFAGELDALFVCQRRIRRLDAIKQFARRLARARNNGVG
jgi:hypothetical protein